MEDCGLNRNNMKPALTLDKQVELLKSRGMTIPDADTKLVKNALRITNYYRLSAYYIDLYDRKNEIFDKPVTFDKVYDIYCFDEKLRHLLFSVIEPIELRLRAEIAYNLAIKYGNVAHLCFSAVQDKKLHLKFLEIYYSNLSSLLYRPYVKHNIKKYGELPIWAAVETMSFGTLCRYYNNLENDTKKIIATSFNSDIDKLGGWFKALNEIRNICAHSDRIYNAKLNTDVKLYTEDRDGLSGDENRTLFLIIIILKKIYAGDGSKWIPFYDELKELVKEYSSVINLKCLGFPEYWQNKIDNIAVYDNNHSGSSH